ncbi:MAG: hypothetical protein V2A77_12005 [Pseudomonadota bacterium]
MRAAVLLATLLCLALPCPSSATEAAGFTEGYKNAKWGMSPDDARQCFPGIKITEDVAFWHFWDDGPQTDTPCGIKSRRLKLYFNDDKHLYRVLLCGPLEGKEPLKVFECLEAELTGKYGPPEKKDSCHPKGVRRVRTWLTPETSVTLSCEFTYRIKDTRNLEIDYLCKPLAPPEP